MNEQEKLRMEVLEARARAYKRITEGQRSLAWYLLATLCGLGLLIILGVML